MCCLCAKYRTIPFSLIIRPLFPSFLHHHCLQILYATNFLIENVFYLLVSLIFVHTRSLGSAPDPFAAADGLHHRYAETAQDCANDDHCYVNLGLGMRLRKRKAW